MAESFESGALLGHVYALEDGPLVRLRLARGSDAPMIRRLLEAAGDRVSDLDLAALVHFDPRRRYVVCATGLMDAAETLLGVGAIALNEAAELELLVVDKDQPGELGDLLRGVLVGCAEGRARAA